MARKSRQQTNAIVTLFLIITEGQRPSCMPALYSIFFSDTDLPLLLQTIRTCKLFRRGGCRLQRSRMNRTRGPTIICSSVLYELSNRVYSLSTSAASLQSPDKQCWRSFCTRKRLFHILRHVATVWVK